MKKIIDEFTNLNISRTRKYHLRNEKKGKCRLCGKKKFKGYKLCKLHYFKVREYRKKYRKKYYQENKEKLYKKQAEYRKTHPEKVRIWNKKFRTKHQKEFKKYKEFYLRHYK